MTGIHYIHMFTHVYIYIHIYSLISATITNVMKTTKVYPGSKIELSSFSGIVQHHCHSIPSTLDYKVSVE